MICEDILNLVLRRYGIGEPIEEDRASVIVNRLRELCDETPPGHTSFPENADEKLIGARSVDQMRHVDSHRESAGDVGDQNSLDQLEGVVIQRGLP
jgi:hypothetical protein